MKYLILRPTLWYVKGNTYTEEELRKNFRPYAFTQLVNDGFLEAIPDAKEKVFPHPDCDESCYYVQKVALKVLIVLM